MDSFQSARLGLRSVVDGSGKVATGQARVGSLSQSETGL